MTDQQAAQAEQTIGPIGLVSPLGAEKPPQAPDPDAVWHFGSRLTEDDYGRPIHQGNAWVYYAEGHNSVVRPVIMADGFDSGHSDLDRLYDGFENGVGGFPLISRLHAQGRDVIIYGYGDRSASILENAKFMIHAIRRTIDEQQGHELLTVGGFSMGGLVTRYALAKMESERIDHRTGTYFSYDSPHRGGWVPIGLQAFAHYLKDINPFNAALSDQINSDASRQLLWRHIETVDDKPEQDQLRTEFLDALEAVGSWPRIPRKIGVANGRGDGVGNGVPAGEVAMRSTGVLFNGTTLYTQGSGDGQLVAELKANLGADEDVRTPALPELDGAPGGTLESFGIAADALRKFKPLGDAEDPHRTICFVPAVSAVAIRDLDEQEDLYADIRSIPAQESELDEFKLASANEEHTLITEELCTWLLERI